MGRPKLTEKQRFQNNIEKVEILPSGCWLWHASIMTNGYGRLHNGVKGVLAHRYFYEQIMGPIPEGLSLDHLCRVRNCVNPFHLEPVTCGENLRRGETFIHRQIEKTHCPKGHPYAGENLKTYKSHRECRTCVNERKRVGYVKSN